MQTQKLVTIGDPDRVLVREEHDRPAAVHARDRQCEGRVAVDLSGHAPSVTVRHATGIGLSSRET